MRQHQDELLHQFIKCEQSLEILNLVRLMGEVVAVNVTHINFTSYHTHKLMGMLRELLWQCHPVDVTE